MNIYNKEHPLRVVTLCSGYNSIVIDNLTAIFSELFFHSGQHYADKKGQLSLF